MSRKVEPWWRPHRLAARRPNLVLRAAAARAVRTYFEQQDFVEVETPALQISPGMEPHLQAFATGMRRPGRPSPDIMYLHSSPEFAMKKLLAAGVPRIFQLARTFRNGERSPTHHPEFTMLEWYRAGADLDALMTDCEQMLRAAAREAGVSNLRWGGANADPEQRFERLSVAAAFARDAGIDILATAPDPAAPSLDLLAAAARPLGIAPRPGDRWEDLFFRVFLEQIEPKLGIGRPTLLYDYPLGMAALARVKAGDPRVAERFELYVCGLELANAFGELTDVAEQRRRFERDQALKQSLYGERYPIDEDFLAALATMPPASGIALGFDRLVMLLAGAEHIEDVLWAPVAAPEGD
ncbi:MAG: EF-P lysine aminoacylase EpmA [Alphaproteobacteria bacterium]